MSDQVIDAVATDEGDPFAKLSERPADGALGVADAEPGVGILGRRRWRRGRRKRDAEQCGQEVQRGDDDDDGLGTGDLDHQRPEQREAHRERRVEGQGEDAVRRQQLAARDQDRDHRQLGRGEEHGDRRDGDVEQQDHREVGARQVQRDERGAAQQVGRDEDDPPVDAVHVDAGDGREQHGGHEERQDEQADGGVRLRRVEDDDRQPEQHHVAADLGRRLRQPESEEAAVAEDRERAALLLLGFGDGRLGRHSA